MGKLSKGIEGVDKPFESVDPFSGPKDLDLSDGQAGAVL
jgi:hypothetical protein